MDCSSDYWSTGLDKSQTLIFIEKMIMRYDSACGTRKKYEKVISIKIILSKNKSYLTKESKWMVI